MNALRLDGRTNEQTRELVVALDVVRAASGSAYVELGSTKVTCAVYGPRRATRASDDMYVRGKVDVDVAFAPFASRDDSVPLGASSSASASSRRDARDPRARACALAVRACVDSTVMLDRFPKSQLSVFITVLSARGSEDVACALAASAALASSGTESRDVASACACALVRDAFVVDPTNEEVDVSDGVVFVSYASARDEIVATAIKGRMNAEACERACAAATEGCRGFDRAIRDALRARVERQG